MREGWVKKKLGEVCEIKYGTRVVQKKDGGTIYPVYGGGGATFKMDLYNREDSIIVSRFAMSSKCVRYVSGKFFLNDSGLTVSPKGSDILQTFIDKHLIFLNDEIYELGKGIAQRNLDVKSFKELIISYPLDIHLQHRIVSELDCLTGIIEKKKEQLKQLDDLAQSIFYDMFGDPVENEKGWDISLLRDFASFKNGLNFKKLENGNLVHFLSISDFLDRKKIDNLDDFSTIEIDQEIDKNFYLKDEDIVFVRSNGNKKLVGRSIIVYPGLNKVTYSGFCIRCRISKNNVTFIGFLLSTPSIRTIIENLGRGANISNLNQQLLGSILIIQPPLSLQQEFALKIEAIEHQKELIKKSLSETEELFNSRMDYYFG